MSMRCWRSAGSKGTNLPPIRTRLDFALRLASLYVVGEGVLSGSGLSLVSDPSGSVRNQASVALKEYWRTDCRSWVVACEDTLASRIDL